MASQDSWIDARELADLASELAPPPVGDPTDDGEADPYAAREPFAPLETGEAPEPVPMQEALPPAPLEEESRGAAPQVVALWSRKLAEIKRRAQNNGLISGGTATSPDAQPKAPFHAPTGSLQEKFRALSCWLEQIAPECEFFACDDWGDELIAGAGGSSDLSAVALALSRCACEAGARGEGDAPAFLCTDLGAGLLTVFPSEKTAGRCFLAAVSEEPPSLAKARKISSALRSII